VAKGPSIFAEQPIFVRLFSLCSHELANDVEKCALKDVQVMMTIEHIGLASSMVIVESELAR